MENLEPMEQWSQSLQVFTGNKESKGLTAKATYFDFTGLKSYPENFEQPHFHNLLLKQ